MIGWRLTTLETLEGPAGFFMAANDGLYQQDQKNHRPAFTVWFGRPFLFTFHPHPEFSWLPTAARWDKSYGGLENGLAGNIVQPLLVTDLSSFTEKQLSLAPGLYYTLCIEVSMQGQTARVINFTHRGTHEICALDMHMADPGMQHEGTSAFCL